MPWNLLLLPLAAGYYVLTRLNCFKFTQQRLDRQRLIFDTVLFGIIIIVLTFFVKSLVYLIIPKQLDIVYNHLPLKIPYFGTSLCSFFLSVLFTETANKFVFKDYKHQINEAIKKVGDELELILRTSVNHQQLLQFTLKNDKVYIAWAKELPIPTVSNNIRVIPVFSGYRDEEKRLIFTTHYLSVYAEYIKEGQAQAVHDLDVDLIIMLDSIITVSFFDIEMYEKFSSNKNAFLNE